MYHIILLSLFYLSYQDWNFKEVYVSSLIWFIFFNLFESNNVYLLPLSALGLVFYYMYYSKIMIADIVVLIGCLNLISPYMMGFFIVLTGLLGIFYSFYYQEKEIPMIPCMSLAYFVLFLTK